MKRIIQRINPSNFTWQLWRGGTLLDLGVFVNVKEFILAKDAVLRKYAIGYCRGCALLCRPKNDCYGVMFQKEGLQFWTHLSIEEFEQIFGESNE